MLEVTNIRVRSFDLDYMDVSWETTGREDPLDYTFRVLRSEASEGPYEPVSGVFTDRYVFRDSTAPTMNFDRTLYYRVLVTARVGGAFRAYPAVGGASLSARPDLQALEIARLVRLGLQEHNGREVWILPVRTFGQRCTACYSPVDGSKTRSGCLTCWDTTFVGGYLSPVRAYMNIARVQGVTTLLDAGSKKQVATAQGMLSNYPEVRAQYVIVEAENLRWKVGSPVEVSEKLRWVYAQYPSLTLIPASDVIYRFPIKDADDVREPSPERQFTLPADPQYAKDLST